MRSVRSEDRTRSRQAGAVPIRTVAHLGSAIATSSRAPLELALNMFATQGGSSVSQYNRIDDPIPFNLRGDECTIFRQFLAGESHFSAVFE
jgi:hypothetical protein